MVHFPDKLCSSVAAFVLFPSKYFFLAKWSYNFVFTENLLSLLFPVPKKGGDHTDGFLNIMRCPFHMFIQSYINSDNLISRLFPLVAASSRGVAVPPQADKVRCLKVSPVRSPPDLSVLHRLCFGSLTDELLHPWDHSSTALWCVFVLTLEGHSGWSSCGKCTEHQGSAESCCSCRREMRVSDCTNSDLSKSSIWKNPFRS